MTHLHLRRASWLQTASCTFSLRDYPNFERWSRSDVSQIRRKVANPVASPQPVVGIHFEVIIGEGLIVIPPCFSNSLGEPHIHPDCSARTHTRRGYNVTRSGQVYAAVASGAGIHCFQHKLEVNEGSPCDPHKEMLLMVVDSAAPQPPNVAATSLSPSALRAVVVIIPNQLLHRARLRVTLQSNAQVPVGHDEHTNQRQTWSKNASKTRRLKRKKAKCTSASCHDHIWRESAKCHVTRSAPPLDKPHSGRVDTGGAVNLDTLVTCVSLCGGSGKVSMMMPCASGSRKCSPLLKAKCWLPMSVFNAALFCPGRPHLHASDVEEEDFPSSSRGRKHCFCTLDYLDLLCFKVLSPLSFSLSFSQTHTCTQWPNFFRKVRQKQETLCVPKL